MNELKPCTQERCAHHPANNKKVRMELSPGEFIEVDSKDCCPECSDCGAGPQQINEDCVNCWNCLKDEGYTRDGVPGMIKQALKEKYGVAPPNPEPPAQEAKMEAITR